MPQNLHLQKLFAEPRSSCTRGAAKATVSKGKLQIRGKLLKLSGMSGAGSKSSGKMKILTLQMKIL